MIASNKFASILSTSVIIGLIFVVIVLMCQVRTLYHDHLKFYRLRTYKSELDSIASKFGALHEDLDQVGKEFEVVKNAH